MDALPLKIISLVPSWTETLLACDVNVIARTRFCIHPEQTVEKIPIVGGTKNFDIEKIKALSPDYILVDKQENTKEMAEILTTAGFNLLITDVTDFKSVIVSLKYLGVNLKNEKLNQLAHRYQKILDKKPQINKETFFSESLLVGSAPDMNLIKDFAYVIWKKPFMVVGDSTFIADNFKLIGIEFNTSEKYPEIKDGVLKQKFCFFSSEPFPFLKHYDDLLSQGFRGVVIDGEKLSWYGIRNLNFIEGCLGPV